MLMRWDNIWKLGLRAESLLGDTVVIVRTLLLSWGPWRARPVTAARLPG